MKRTRPIDWQEIARRGRNHAVLCMSIFMEGFRQRQLVPGRRWGFAPTVYRQFSGARWFSGREMVRFRRSFIAAERRRPGFLAGQARKYIRLIASIRRWCRRTQRIVFANLQNRRLADTLEQYVSVWTPTARFVYNYILVNEYLAQEVSSAVIAKQSDIHRQMQDVFTLITPIRKTEARQEKEALARLAQRVRDRHLRIGEDRWRRAVNRHLARFAHLNRYIYYGRSYTPADIAARVRALLRGSALDNTLQELRASEPRPTRIRELLRAYRIDRPSRLKVEAARWWAFVPNFWDETFISLVHQLMPMFQTIAARLGVTYDELIELQYQEILDHLRRGRKVSQQLRRELHDRYRDSAQILESGRVRLLQGASLRTYYRQESKQTRRTLPTNARELKGQAASPGLARGTVALVLSVKEVGKVKRGQVLVAAATTPMHVPAMEKAVAIVTDEGGLLSHAAIVSREMHLPCVVGTKIATKVFKDGDRVEVDAEKGVVRKI